MLYVAYIALGSNLGDRHGYLAAARQALAALPSSRLLACSRIEETEPIGPAGQGAYLNQMVALETEMAPGDLLAEIHRIERAAGRELRERWGARTLDLDIVLFAHQRVSEPGLTVPHPELPNRGFWQRELAELGVEVSA